MGTLSITVTLKAPFELIFEVKEGKERKLLAALIDAAVVQYGMEVTSLRITPYSLARFRAVKALEAQGDYDVEEA